MMSVSNKKAVCFVALTILMWLLSISCSSKDIVVSNQTEFDNLSSCVQSALAQGETDINIILQPGTYYYSEYHFNFYNHKYPAASVSLNGRGSVLVAASKAGTTYEPDNAIVVGGEEQFCWSEANYLDSKVEILNSSAMTCRVKIPAGTTVPSGATHILITQWFRSSSYPISAISGGYIYFKADDLSRDPSVKEYNVNHDCYYYRGTYPRYKLYVPHKSNEAHLCSCTVFLNLGECALKSFTMKEITFIGNRNDKGRKELLQLSTCDANQVIVEKCRFYGIHSTILGIYDSSNVIFRNNLISDCYGNGIYMANSSSNVSVEKNLFVNTGLDCTNTSCVRCEGSDFTITRNRFCDFGSIAISTGVHYKLKKEFPCTGRIDSNEIYYSDLYFKNIKDFGLMDSGAIYLTTQNDRIIISNNNIHDYTGIKDNRGIFCDDGACNFTIVNNVIQNTPNSYSIDSRLCPEMLTDPGTQVNQVNVGNTIKRNKVDGKIRSNNIIK